MASRQKPASGRKDLKSLVKQQFERVSNAAVSKGEVKDEDLEKLMQLSELHAALPGSPAYPTRHWPLILLSLAIFLVPGVMISLKVPVVEVQFNLLVSELSWQQKLSGDIMGHVNLDSLDVSAFDSISLPLTQLSGAEVLQLPPANFWVPDGGDGKISMAPVHAKSGTRVWLSKMAGETAAILSMKGPDTRATVNLGGSVGIDAGGERLGERNFGRGRPVQIQAGGPNLLNLALNYDGDQNMNFPSHIMISSLSLQEIEDVVSDGTRTPRTISTVLEGEIFNESMNGRNYKLRKGEWLLIDGVVGEIRSMQMTADGIRLDFHGNVSSISVGSSSNQRDLMPNWLEWFGERHSVKMLWGAFLWLLTTLFGVIKWWRRSH